LAAAVAVTASAGEFRVSCWAGYGTVSMGALNEQLRARADHLVELSSGFPAAVIPVNGGALFGVDIMYHVSPRLAVGPRIASLSVAGEIAGRTTIWGYNDIDPPYDPLYRARLTVTASAMPVLFGASYTRPVTARITAGGGFFAGYAAADMYSRLEWYKDSGYQESTYVQVYGTGAGPAIETGAWAVYAFSPDVAVRAGLELRYCAIPRLRQYRIYETYYVGKTRGIVIGCEDDQGTPLLLDFSGLQATAGVQYRF